MADTVYGTDQGPQAGSDDGSKAFVPLFEDDDDDRLWDTVPDLRAMVPVISIAMVASALVLMVVVGFYTLLYKRRDRCLYAPIYDRGHMSDIDDIDCTSSETDFLEANGYSSSVFADEEANCQEGPATEPDSDWSAHRHAARTKCRLPETETPLCDETVPQRLLQVSLQVPDTVE